MKTNKIIIQYQLHPQRLCTTCERPLVFDAEYQFFLCLNGCHPNYDWIPLATPIGVGGGLRLNRRTHYKIEGLRAAEFVSAEYGQGLRAYRLDKNGRRMDGLFLELLPPEKWLLNKKPNRQLSKRRAPKTKKAAIKKQAREAARLQAAIRVQIAERKRQALASKPCPAWAVGLMTKHNQ